MRKLLITMILLTGLMPVTVAAQGSNVGYVDVQYLIDNSPQAKAATADLEEKFGPQQEQLRQQQQEFQRLQQKLQKDGLVMAEDERGQIEQRLRELKREIQRGQQAFREELNIQRSGALSQVREAVLKAVEDMARDEGYDLIVGQGVLYAGDAVDLTQRVLERMKERFETAGSE
ncbi:MAG: OmpH family outer membrane protein [Halofilum sp. (in: g-proteobacteria)]|nr:OmpH family outer membrane protein [Halofilum sp. (in: g-proteobacteria)]